MNDILEAKVCPYCGSGTKLVDSSVVYNRSFGPVYVCKNFPECDAYVGCHPKSLQPLGRLANRTLRAWKKNAHTLFDPLWKQGAMSRREAYSWLAVEMDLPEEVCHIGMFDVEQCKEVVRVVKRKRELL